MSYKELPERTGKLGERMEYNSVDDPVKRISLKASGFRILVVVGRQVWTIYRKK